MADKVFALKNRTKKQRDLTIDEIKHEALLEVARNPVIRQYFQILIQGYNEHIIENSRPSKIDENKMMLIELHAKKESLEKLLRNADEERKQEG